MAVVSPGGLVLSIRISDRHRSTSEANRDSSRAARRDFATPRTQSRPRVAARSPRDTVESVVERTNTPPAGAVMVSTSSP